MDLQPVFQGERLQRIHRSAIFARRAKHTDDVFVPLEKFFQHGFPECLLTVDYQSHLTHLPFAPIEPEHLTRGK